MKRRIKKRKRKEATTSGTCLVARDITIVIIGQKRNGGSITYFLTSLLWLVYYSHQGDIKFK
jgi:hypothetical protein